MQNIRKFQEDLLKWYWINKRSLPWRLSKPNPYATWVSEIMLQQTTVPAVIPYFQRFLGQWPTVESLAHASLDEVLHLWQGLGYYSRARNLHKCAKKIVSDFGGGFPCDEKTLKSLPGIGEYTAAALGAIAFNHPTIVMDGNIERIISRLFLVKEPLPKAKPILKSHAGKIASTTHPGDYAQALMDLGSSICTPKSPLCRECPLSTYCKAFNNSPEDYPKKQPKKSIPRKHAALFWVEDLNGNVLIERRPEKGLLGGLMGFPTSPWEEEKPTPNSLKFSPIEAQWESVEGTITHTFTHFHLTFSILRARVQNPLEGLWVARKDLVHHAFPTLMQKVIQLMDNS
jgi:A/G-specific adenine glycosylase